MIFDPMYFVFLAPGMLLALWAQMKLKGTYAKYSKIANYSGFNGARAAQRVLDTAGITDVGIEETQGYLSDHYDPRAKMLRLSPEVYRGNSIASVGIAAHEAGHAIQHAEGYFPLHVRSALVPLAGFGSNFAFFIIMGGAMLAYMGSAGLGGSIVEIGIILFAAVVAFQIVTLPVEFDASARAKKLLTTTGITVTEDETAGVRKVLSAAAMTYVAATVTAILTLAYFIFRYGGMTRD